MVKSVRLAAHPNTLLLMSSAASYGVGEKGVDIMVTTAEHAHENRAKGDVEGSVNQDEDFQDEGEDEDEDYDNERNKAKNKTDEELEEDERVEQYRAGYRNLENNRCASSARAFEAVFENVDLRAMGRKGLISSRGKILQRRK